MNTEALESLRLSARKDFFTAAAGGLVGASLSFVAGHTAINAESLLAGLVSLTMVLGTTAAVGGFVSRGVNKLLQAQLIQIMGDTTPTPPKPNLKLV